MSQQALKVSLQELEQVIQLIIQFLNQGTTEWEVGLGTVTDATPDTLARTTVISSSNSDAAVNFTSGTKDVFCTLPASKAVYLDASGTSVPAFSTQGFAIAMAVAL